MTEKKNGQNEGGLSNKQYMKELRRHQAELGKLQGLGQIQGPSRHHHRV